MTARVPIAPRAVVPALDDVLRAQGIPPDAIVSERVTALAQASLDTFLSQARPGCITADVSCGEFAGIFHGEGRNEDEAPLAAIYPRADRLVLFALTMGHELSRTIAGHMDNHDFACGSMLDAVASLAVENAIGLLENHVTGTPAGDRAADGDRRTLNYSPGYCGWHISAQVKLFRYLDPGQLGITLNESCLMTPLKSATGVLVQGDRALHDFDIGFRFCRSCRDKTCLERRSCRPPAHPPAT